MTDTPENPVEDPMAAWATLGADLAAAYERDRANGLRGAGSLTGLAQLVRETLKPWLEGRAHKDASRLQEWLYSIMGWPAPTWTAEQETAKRWLTPEAQGAMAEEILKAGDREVSFVLRRQSDGRFGEPVVTIRGNQHQTWAFGRDMPADGYGLIVHQHPDGNTIPSDGDLQMVQHFLLSFPLSGHGLLSPDCSRLYMVRDPRPVEAAP